MTTRKIEKRTKWIDHIIKYNRNAGDCIEYFHSFVDDLSSFYHQENFEGEDKFFNTWSTMDTLLAVARDKESHVEKDRFPEVWKNEFQEEAKRLIQQMNELLLSIRVEVFNIDKKRSQYNGYDVIGDRVYFHSKIYIKYIGEEDRKAYFIVRSPNNVGVLLKNEDLSSTDIYMIKAKYEGYIDVDFVGDYGGKNQQQDDEWLDRIEVKFIDEE